MLVDASKNVAKIASNLYCDFCDYNTCKLYNYRKHLSTDKHKNNENASKMLGNASKKVAKVANNYSYVKIVLRNIKITLDYGDIKKNVLQLLRHKLQNLPIKIN